MSDGSEDGFALIAVLWMLTLLSIVAATLSLETRSGTRIARNLVDRAAVRAAADAGIQRAILDLIASPRSPTDTGKFRADGKVYAWPFLNSTVRISVQDERGKINLNEAPEALLAALFGSVGVDPGKAQSLADAIADFRDTDDFVRGRGAEAADYQAAGLAWGPKNAPFQTVEELQQVFGMTPEIYQRVAPYLTIYSVAGEINPALVGERVAAILRQTDFGSEYFSRSPGMVYSIRAEARGYGGAMFVREAVVQLIPEGDTCFQILAWAQGVPKNSRGETERNATQ